MSQREKRAIIRRLLTPIIIIIAILLYQPVRRMLQPDAVQETSVTRQDGNLTVSYLDVGQGDATLISKDRFHMLIDAGNNSAGDTVVRCLREAGVEKLDILVGTHPDADHIGGLDVVMENIPVDTLYLPESKKATKTYQDVERVMEDRGITARMPEIGKEQTYEENVLIRFLSPLKNYSGANDNSLVVQLAYGKNRFLFMGDAENAAETDMVKAGYDLRCDVLKLGHHGSYTATGEEFLKKADPTYGIISCGKGNSYGHPHAETLARLEDEDVQVYRTDTMGTVLAVSDGKYVTMSTKEGSGSP